MDELKKKLDNASPEAADEMNKLLGFLLNAIVDGMEEGKDKDMGIIVLAHGEIGAIISKYCDPEFTKTLPDEDVRLIREQVESALDALKVIDKHFTALETEDDDGIG